MNHTITAEIRNTKPEALRAASKIPAVVYGAGKEPMSIAVVYNAFEKLYNEAGESTLITLEGLPEEKVVLIQDVQYHPTKRNIIHADFREIEMGKELDVPVELTFIGVAPATKMGGTLTTQTTEIMVRCLPKNLVSHIDVDLSVLKTFDDVIHISDLAIPQGLEVLESMDTLVANIIAPLTEEQLAAQDAAEARSIEDIAVEEKGKKEDKDAEE